MADLESALHYILRIEVGKFSVLEGQRLVALKKFVALLAKVSGAWPPLPAVPCVISVHACRPQSCQPLPLGVPDLARCLGPQLPQPTLGCYPPVSAISHTSTPYAEAGGAQGPAVQ